MNWINCKEFGDSPPDQGAVDGGKRRRKNSARQQKWQVSATKQSAPGDQTPATFFLLRAFIHKVFSSCFSFVCMNEKQSLGAIKRGSPGHYRRLRSPLSLRSLHSSLRNHFGPSLGCQTRENWEVGVGVVGVGAWTTRRTGTPPSLSLRRLFTTRTISCPPTNQLDRRAGIRASDPPRCC